MAHLKVVASRGCGNHHVLAALALVQQVSVHPIEHPHSWTSTRTFAGPMHVEPCRASRLACFGFAPGIATGVAAAFRRGRRFDVCQPRTARSQFEMWAIHFAARCARGSDGQPSLSMARWRWAAPAWP